MTTIKLTIAKISLVILCHKALSSSYHEQVHLSLGVNPNQMIVTWATMSKPDTPVLVRVFGQQYNKTFLASTTWFQAGFMTQRKLYIHRATITDLTPRKTYWYNVGDANAGWSNTFKFRALDNNPNVTSKLIVYGDMGLTNARILPGLKSEIKKENVDVIIHAGDFAYDLNMKDGMVGDAFMRMIEPIAAYVPYMTSVGNHEDANNFSHYDNRFTMLQSNGQINNHFYSFDHGSIHVVVVSTEFYFTTDQDNQQIEKQYNWLTEDFMKAKENRKERPWIIIIGHRPLYCSAKFPLECDHNANILRKGIPPKYKFGLEDLFYKNGVDLVITAHEHHYERTFPVYNSTGMFASLDSFKENASPWSAARIAAYSYTRIVANRTTLQIEQISADMVLYLKNLEF